MAVLVEAISVVVRRVAIEERFHGGWREFEAAVPNGTLCADKELARVGFMTPPDVEAFVSHLEMSGLTFARNGQAVDIQKLHDLQAVLATLYVAIAQLAVAILPIIPASASRLLDAMGIALGLRDFAAIQSPWYLTLVASKFKLEQPVGLFPRLEMPTEAA